MTTNKEIKNIAKTISQAVPAEKIYLFGSYANGVPEQDSDYDFFVILSDGAMRPIEAMQEAHRAIYPLELDIPVDVLATTHSNFDIMRNMINSVEREVDLKGVLLYERDGMGA